MFEAASAEAKMCKLVICRLLRVQRSETNSVDSSTIHALDAQGAIFNNDLIANHRYASDRAHDETCNGFV